MKETNTRKSNYKMTASTIELIRKKIDEEDLYMKKIKVYGSSF